ncbi:MAG TPA: RES family NAD+ phosphorylase [Vicinamibacterales bacterium]|nr:RES family NAD+ phosphorylase [Vicinamibacterales bacterium]
MRPEPPVSDIAWPRTCRLVPSRYPTVGVFDRVAAPEDLPELFELEGWTNDRLSNDLGLLNIVPPAEWVVGPMASVVMAAFCHPRAEGARFTDSTRGAWYAARDLETALAESTHRRTKELQEIGVLDTRVQMRLYHADFEAPFHDVRTDDPASRDLHDRDDHTAAQEFGMALFRGGANGIVYSSVRRDGGECLVSFRPKLVTNVRAAGHFEYRWRGSSKPDVTALA